MHMSRRPPFGFYNHSASTTRPNSKGRAIKSGLDVSFALTRELAQNRLSTLRAVKVCEDGILCNDSRDVPAQPNCKLGLLPRLYRVLLGLIEQLLRAPFFFLPRKIISRPEEADGARRP